MRGRPFSIFTNEISNVHAAALILGAAGLLSRILGIVRDRLLAAHFGAGRELDIYYAAFQIPDFLAVLFLLGAASSAILPIFQEYLEEDREKAHRFIGHLFYLFLAGSLVFSVAAFFFAPWGMRFVAPGFSSHDLSRAVNLTRLFLFSPILFGLSGILSAVIESFRRFIPYALSSIFYNAGIVIGIIVFVPMFGLWGLGAGVLLGAFFNFMTFLVPAFQLGMGPSFHWRLKEEYAGVRRMLRISFPRVLSVSLTQLTLIGLVALGSTLAEGSIAVFTLAQNLYFVPIGIFALSYTVPVFPRLSRAYIARDGEAFFDELFLGIRSIVFWMLPSTTLFIVLRAHMVRVAFGAGAFSWEDTRLTASVFAAFSIALVGGGLISLLVKGFYALDNTWKPLFINIGGAILSLGTGLVLMILLASPSPLRYFFTAFFRISDMPRPEVLGLGLGFSLGVMVNAVFLYLALRRFAVSVFRIEKKFPHRELTKMVAAACGAGIVAYAVRASFSQSLPLITFARVLLQGFISGAIGFGAYAGLLILFKSEDMKAVQKSITKKLFRISILPKSWNGEHYKNI